MGSSFGFLIVALVCSGDGYFCDQKPYEAPAIIYPTEFDCTWKLSTISESEVSKYHLKCVELKGQQW